MQLVSLFEVHFFHALKRVIYRHICLSLEKINSSWCSGQKWREGKETGSSSFCLQIPQYAWLWARRGPCGGGPRGSGKERGSVPTHFATTQNFKYQLLNFIIF